MLKKACFPLLFVVFLTVLGLVSNGTEAHQLLGQEFQANDRLETPSIGFVPVLLARAFLADAHFNAASAVERVKPPRNADGRGCSSPLIGVNRRVSAVPQLGVMESLATSSC
jgi:hypothetical protein